MEAKALVKAPADRLAQVNVEKVGERRFKLESLVLGDTLADRLREKVDTLAQTLTDFDGEAPVSTLAEV